MLKAARRMKGHRDRALIYLDVLHVQTCNSEDPLRMGRQNGGGAFSTVLLVEVHLAMFKG